MVAYAHLYCTAVNGLAHGFLFVYVFFTSCLGSKEVQYPQSRDSCQLFKNTALSKVKRTWAQLLKIFVIKIKLSYSLKLDGVFVCECSVMKKYCSSAALSLSFHLQSVHWGRMGAYIMCSCSQFTEHLGWTPASFHLGEAPALIIKITSFQPWEVWIFVCFSEGCLFYWTVPFHIQNKTNPNKRLGKKLTWIFVCAFDYA